MSQMKVLYFEESVHGDGVVLQSEAGSITTKTNPTTSTTNGEINGSEQFHLKQELPATQTNVATILSKFDQLTLISNIMTLAQIIFEAEYTDCLILFIVTTEDVTKSYEHIQFACGNMMHVPNVIIALAKDKANWSSFVKAGAHEVCGAQILQHDMDVYIQKISVLQTELKTRLGELKHFLGLTPDETHHQPRYLSQLYGAYQLVNAPDVPIKFNLNYNQQKIQKAIQQWEFRTHDLDYNELLLAAFLIFKHAFTIPNLDRDLILSDSKLFSFLCIIKNCYHSSNPYHNFRHAVDVLQASYYMLLRIDAIPQVATNTPGEHTLHPSDALAVLIAALGHDAGHPGVTNAFLVSSNSTLAQIYNDKSVLESYHCSLICHIAQYYWPKIFQSTTNQKGLIVESILSTDMAMHFDYMSKFENVQCWASFKRKAEETSSPRECQFPPQLISCMIIKCADISNVTRSLDISSTWGRVLAQEIHWVNLLEDDMGLNKDKGVAKLLVQKQSQKQTQGQTNNGTVGDSVPVARTDKDLAAGQLFFVNTYARPLFKLLVNHFPQLQFMMDNLQANYDYWESLLNESKDESSQMESKN